MPVKPKTITTEADRLVELLKAEKEIKLADAARRLGVPQKTVEAWSNFLEEEKVLAIRYQFTTPYLAYIEPEEQTQKKPVRRVFTEIELVEDEFDTLLKSVGEQLESGDYEMLSQTLLALISKIKEEFSLLSEQLTPEMKENTLYQLENIASNVRHAVAYAKAGKVDNAKAIYYTSISYLRSLLVNFKARAKAQAEAAAEESIKAAEPLKALPQRAGVDASTAKTWLERAYNLMAQGKFDDAVEIYNRLRQSYADLPRKFIENRHELEADLVKLNKDLALGVERQAAVRVKEASAQIRQLLGAAGSSIRKRDFRKAESHYSQIKHVFDRLPPGFIKEKKAVQAEVLKLYNYLSENRNKAFSGEMKTRVAEINSLVASIRQYMSERNISAAISAYNKVKKIYDALPEGFMAERAGLQDKILQVYEILAADYRQVFQAEMQQRTQEINALVEEMKGKLMTGQRSPAEQLYEKIKAVYSTLPEGFLSEKTALQHKILDAYDGLLKLADATYDKDMNTRIAEIEKILEGGFAYVRNKKFGLAQELYAELVKDYNGLPSGYSPKKTGLRNNLLKLYSEILINRDSLLLQGAGEETQKTYKEILGYLVKMHHEIEKQNLNVLEIDYSHLLRLYNELPLGLVKQNPELGANVKRMGEEVELYRKVSGLESLAASGNMGKLMSEINEIIGLKARLESESPEDKELFEYADRMIANYSSTKAAPIPSVPIQKPLGRIAMPAPWLPPNPTNPNQAEQKARTAESPPSPNKAELRARIAELNSRAAQSFKMPGIAKK